MSNRVVAKKITGHAMLWSQNGLRCIIVVQDRDRAAAVDLLNAGGFAVASEEHIRPVTMIPGHCDDLFPGAVELDCELQPPVEPIEREVQP